MDTNPSIAVEWTRRILALSGEQRMLMCSAMQESTRVMVLASMESGLSGKELRIRILNRFYGTDLTEACRSEIIRGFREG